MSDFDFSKLQGVKLNIDTPQFNLNPAQDMLNKISRENDPA